MRTLFAKFLLWFWLALIVLLGAEFALEATSLRHGLVLRREESPGPFAFYADLARDALQDDGLAGLHHFLHRIEGFGQLTTYCVDRVGIETDGRPLPRGARAAALGALRSGTGVLVESPGGFFVGYPIGHLGALDLALVLHPSGAARERGHGESEGFPFLPEDLGVRAVAMLVIGGIGCYFLARYITAPVSRLRQATRRLAAGDLSARVSSDWRRRDEVADLGRDFDRMAARLETLISAERRLLRNVSHELRSPLARMNVALGLLRQRDVEDPDGMLGRIETEAGRLDRLVGDVLTLSRTEASEPEPAPQPVDLGDLVADVAEDARFEARDRDCQVQVTCPETVVVDGAPDLLRSAVENVVRNAVRYTREGTAVEIAVARRAESGSPEAVIEVRDHGPGVAEDQLELVFEPFYRTEDARERGAGGTGLGLTIAKRAVSLHGGRIGATPAPGGGLVVTIRLPLEAAKA